MILDPFLWKVSHVTWGNKYLFREIPRSSLTSTDIFAEFLVYTEMPIEMCVTFCSTVVCVGEPTTTCTALEILRIIQNVNKIRTDSELSAQATEERSLLKRRGCQLEIRVSEVCCIRVDGERLHGNNLRSRSGSIPRRTK
jgi:hypothetical protein